VRQRVYAVFVTSLAILDAQHRIVLALHRLARRFSRTPPIAAHLTTGLDGELEAFFHIRRLGYTVVARRWKTQKVRGDVDLIAWHDGCLCFIEVKTRTRRDAIPAEFAVDRDKERMLKRMAGAYLRRFPEEERNTLPVRFDVVSVYLQQGSAAEFELFPAAFSWTGH